MGPIFRLGHCCRQGVSNGIKSRPSARPTVFQSKPIGDENVYDACKAYVDVLSRRYVNLTAESEIEEAKESSLCAGYIAGFMSAAEYTHYDAASRTATYTSRGYQWCWPTIDKDNKRGQDEALLDIVVLFTNFLAETAVPSKHSFETFTWVAPSFPTAMKKYFPCKESP
jgi:hypothetical protein